MSYYESDPCALSWFAHALNHPTARIRKSALELLVRVDCTDRIQWLRAAQMDHVAEVAAMAIIVETVSRLTDAGEMDLFESDLSVGLPGDVFEWEWEYEIAIAHDFILQGSTHRVWTVMEDDPLARRLSLQKAYVGKLDELISATALIVDKRLVNQYTRSPRSISESRRWARGGRPRYVE